MHDHGDGLYTASYELNISGIYDLYILSSRLNYPLYVKICCIGDDELVSDSPYSVSLSADVPNLKNSVIELPNLDDQVIPINEPFEFFVSPRDQFGNECDYENVIRDFPIEVSLEGRHGQSPVMIDLTLDGRYHCSFRCSIAGNYSLFVTSNSKQLPQSPKSIQVSFHSLMMRFQSLD